VSLASNKEDSPQQVKGKAVAMANPQSLVALVAMQWLKSEGLEAGRDFKTVVTANDDSLGAVLNSGEAPWAVMSMGEFRAKPDALRSTLRIVRQITTVPGFYVMANPKLPAAERAQLKSLVLGFPPTDDGKRFFELSGFKNIRAMVSEDQTFLDPFNDVTRSSLGLKP
jgi:phosphonate transport system substrate-binding protein